MDKVTATRKFLIKKQRIKLIRECQSSGRKVTSWCKQNGIQKVRNSNAIAKDIYIVCGYTIQIIN